MNYRIIALILVPSLGYLSYLLLILGELYRQKKYAHHIVLPEDSLEILYGPLFHPVKEKQWFNPRILFSWIALGGVLGIFYLYREQAASLLAFNVFDFILGCYLTVVLLGTVSTLWPLLIFKFVSEHPSSINGQAQLGGQLVIHQIFYQMISYSLLIICLSTYQPSSFLIGSALVSLMIVLNTWRRIGSMRSSS